MKASQFWGGVGLVSFAVATAMKGIAFADVPPAGIAGGAMNAGVIVFSTIPPSLAVYTMYFTNAGSGVAFCAAYNTNVAPTLGTTAQMGVAIAVPVSSTAPIYFGPTVGVGAVGTATSRFTVGVSAGCTTLPTGSTAAGGMYGAATLQ
jgi:hypothetical protein